MKLEKPTGNALKQPSSAAFLHIDTPPDPGVRDK
jgi:hypothetical protein